MNQIKIHFGKDFEANTLEDKGFDEIFQSGSPVFSLSRQSWQPQMDIFETEDKIIIQAEIAGVGQEDIKIELNAHAVKISGSRKISHPDPAASYRLAEIQYGRFERRVQLPAPIDVSQVASRFNNGFLELTLGKHYQKGRVRERQVVDLI